MHLPQIRQLISIGMIIVEVRHNFALVAILAPLSLMSAPSHHVHIAIHEIFDSNAKRFPNRQCVIETTSLRTAQRTFTYRQINESSNQLAHFFLAHGCEVGDTVMIYAYRGSVLLTSSLSSLADGDVGLTLWLLIWALLKLGQLSA